VEVTLATHHRCRYPGVHHAAAAFLNGCLAESDGDVVITRDNLKSRVKHVEGEMTGDGCSVFAGLGRVAVDTFNRAGLGILPSKGPDDVFGTLPGGGRLSSGAWNTIGSAGGSPVAGALGTRFAGVVECWDCGKRYWLC
jgi:hypothetical protein